MRLVFKNLETKNKHSEVTMPTIDKVLKDSNVDVSELNNIIVDLINLSFIIKIYVKKA